MKQVCKVRPFIHATFIVCSVLVYSTSLDLLYGKSMGRYAVENSLFAVL